MVNAWLSARYDERKNTVFIVEYGINSE